jgi:hypothetical protein
MNGSEVIIINSEGSEAILGKTKSNGASAMEWFKSAANRNPKRFAALWSDFQAKHPANETSAIIDSKHADVGFRFAIPEWARSLESGALFDALISKAEHSLSLLNREDAYLSSYGDHPILVDLRNGVVFAFNTIEKARAS